jgi:hypothetical protein
MLSNASTGVHIHDRPTRHGRHGSRTRSWVEAQLVCQVLCHCSLLTAMHRDSQLREARPGNGPAPVSTGTGGVLHSFTTPVPVEGPILRSRGSLAAGRRAQLTLSRGIRRTDRVMFRAKGVRGCFARLSGPRGPARWRSCCLGDSGASPAAPTPSSDAASNDSTSILSVAAAARRKREEVSHQDGIEALCDVKLLIRGRSGLSRLESHRGSIKELH